MPNNNSIRRQNLLLDAYTLFKQPWTKGETTPGSPSVGPSACKEKSLELLHLLSIESLFQFSPIIPLLPPFFSHLLNRKTDVWKLFGHKDKLNSIAEKNCSRAFFFFNFHLHLVNPISATSGWLSEHRCTYPPPPPPPPNSTNSKLTRTYYTLTVLEWGEG